MQQTCIIYHAPEIKEKVATFCCGVVCVEEIADEDATLQKQLF